MSQCGVVEPTCTDFTHIKYVGEDSVKVWFKDWKQCSNEVAHTFEEPIMLNGVEAKLEHNVCEKHNKKQAT